MPKTIAADLQGLLIVQELDELQLIYYSLSEAISCTNCFQEG